jgi:hypothetical protein
LLHSAPPPQAVPQAPQLSVSLPRSTHEPSQKARPVEHALAQRPALHTWSALQASAHPPQLAALARVSTQVSPHAEEEP